jgi:hypothetical protein
MTKVKRGFVSRAWRAWFDLTIEERRLLTGILVIVLIGLCARYVALRSERAEPYRPEGIEQVEHKGAR